MYLRNSGIDYEEQIYVLKPHMVTEFYDPVAEKTVYLTED